MLHLNMGYINSSCGHFDRERNDTPVDLGYHIFRQTHIMYLQYRIKFGSGAYSIYRWFFHINYKPSILGYPRLWKPDETPIYQIHMEIQMLVQRYGNTERSTGALSLSLSLP